MMMKVDFRKNATVFLRFNQTTFIPEFAKRRLAEIDDFINQVFEFSLNVADQDLADRLTFNVSFVEWRPSLIELLVNFSDPLLVSTGRIRDTFRVIVRDPSLLISRQTLMPLHLVENSPIEIDVPKQMPQSISETLERCVESVKQSVQVVMVVSTLIQLVLKQSAKKAMTLFVGMQLMVYVVDLSLDMSAVLEFFFTEFSKIIEFQSINVVALLKAAKDDFGLDVPPANRFINDFMVEIMAIAAAVLLVAAASILIVVGKPEHREKVKSKLQQAKRQMMWNGLLVTLLLSIFKQCVKAGNSLRESNGEPASAVVAICTFSALSALTLYFGWFLHTRRHILDTDQMRDLCGSLYFNQPTSNHFSRRFRFPVFMAHRISFALISALLAGRVELQIMIFSQASLAYTAFLFWDRLQHDDLVLKVTKFGVHMMVLQLFLFTPFVSSQQSQLNFSLCYFGSFLGICLVNIIDLIVASIRSIVRRRRLNELKQFFIDTHQERIEHFQRQQKLKEQENQQPPDSPPEQLPS